MLRLSSNFIALKGSRQPSEETAYASSGLDKGGGAESADYHVRAEGFRRPLAQRGAALAPDGKLASALKADGGPARRRKNLRSLTERDG